MTRSLSRNVSLTAIGDVTDINCHSNLPYFLYQEGARQGLFTDPIRLNLEPFKWKRVFWNAKQVTLGRGRGGYQYSSGFLEALHEQVPAHLFQGTVVSFAQAFPYAERVKRAGGEIVYYIDATLTDLFNNPAYDLHVSKWVLKRILERETRNYREAKYVVTRSSWIIPTLVDVYRVERSKIRHILPGANIDLGGAQLHGSQPLRAGTDRVFTLGFVGKDWDRKGLPLLLDVRDELSRRGHKAVVKVVGKAPPDLVSRPGVSFTGFIDKRTQMAKFVETISACDIGCLFSKSEALGISVLEFLRVGVPVAGFYHQGLVDTLLEGASLRFSIGADVKSIADGFERYLLDTDYRESLKRVARNSASSVTWSHTVRQFTQLLGSATSSSRA